MCDSQVAATKAGHHVWHGCFQIRSNSCFPSGEITTTICCAAFTESVNASASCFGGSGKPVDAEKFQAAFMNHRRATFHLHSLEALGVSVDRSPLSVCPICSPRREEGESVLALEECGVCMYELHTTLTTFFCWASLTANID